jgi:hypothetical protein
MIQNHSAGQSGHRDQKPVSTPLLPKGRAFKHSDQRRWHIPGSDEEANWLLSEPVSFIIGKNIPVLTSVATMS